MALAAVALAGPEQVPHISVLAGILVGLAASFVQSLGKPDDALYF